MLKTFAIKYRKVFGNYSKNSLPTKKRMIFLGTFE